MIILDLRLSDRQDRKRKHPTTKPVNICVDFLKHTMERPFTIRERRG